jgi:hypothetical protein
MHASIALYSLERRAPPPPLALVAAAVEGRPKGVADRVGWAPLVSPSGGDMGGRFMYIYLLTRFLLVMNKLSAHVLPALLKNRGKFHFPGLCTN